LLFMVFGVIGLGRMTQTQMAVSAVAREAARTAALANTPGDARSSGADRGYAVGDGYHLSHPPLVVDVNASSFGRCGSVSVHATYPLDFSDLPLLGWARLSLQSTHSEPVDGYRSHLTGAC
jgi:hypothetical protein